MVITKSKQGREREKQKNNAGKKLNTRCNRQIYSPPRGRPPELRPASCASGSARLLSPCWREVFLVMLEWVHISAHPSFHDFLISIPVGSSVGSGGFLVLERTFADVNAKFASSNLLDFPAGWRAATEIRGLQAQEPARRGGAYLLRGRLCTLQVLVHAEIQVGAAARGPTRRKNTAAVTRNAA